MHEHGGRFFATRHCDGEGSNVAVVGECGDGFPVTQDAVEPIFGGGTLDAFLCYLTANGASLAFATYVGGGGQVDVCPTWEPPPGLSRPLQAPRAFQRPLGPSQKSCLLIEITGCSMQASS